MIIHEGFKDIKVTLIGCVGNDLAREVYNFGRLSHDYIEPLPEEYDENNPECIKLIDKIIAGRTLPKYALQGHRLDFRIEKISRICLAQLTRDTAIFASQGGGVFPLTQELNLPLSITQHEDVMEMVKSAQRILEQAYITLAKREVPALEARYIGLHSQVISLTASYLPSDFVRSCWSRTNSNFCDECNYVYRKMYHEVQKMIAGLTDKNSIRLWGWLINENNCMNDKPYNRESLYNSDFNFSKKDVVEVRPAINDWRKSGWKLELERMFHEEPELLTIDEMQRIQNWKSMEAAGVELPTSYDNTRNDVLCNAIEQMDYYKEYVEYINKAAEELE